jgi:hypothetical protein
VLSKPPAVLKMRRLPPFIVGSSPDPTPPPSYPESIRYPIEPPLGFTGRSGILPTEDQGETEWVPMPDRWRSPFPSWDRYGKQSCWARVAQPWAGKGYGMFVLPRVGQIAASEAHSLCFHDEPPRTLRLLCLEFCGAYALTTCAALEPERFQRSQELLHRALTELLACVGSEAALPASSGDPVAAAREALGRKRAPISFSDAADANVHIAEKVWAERLSSCKAPVTDDPLARIMSDLASR